MKRWLRMAAAGAALLMGAAGLTGCSGGSGQSGGGDGEKTVLKISFFKGGYGDEWLKAITAAYTKEHPNVTFDLEGDADMTLKIGPRLESGANLPDIAMVLATNWQQWAAKGYLEDLSDVYAADVDGTAMADKIIEADRNVGKYGGKYWMVPWTDVCNGIIYNETLFAQNGWSEPKTVSEMFTLMEQMKAKGVTPFSFGGKVISYWDFPVLAWWAQAEGMDGMQTFLKMDSPEVYNQQGRLKALEVFEKIIKDKTNYVDGAMGMDHIQSQMAFLQGKAAMIPMGAWMETEMKNSIPEGFKMKMMLTPALDGAKMTDVSVCTSQDMIFIPKKAKNVEVAKDFLKFMARDDMLKLYTEKTGSPRPFTYDIASITGLSDFSNNILDLWSKANKVYMYSESPIYFMKYYYWPAAGTPYSRIQIGDETAAETFSNDYAFAKSKWDATKKELGLD